MSWRDYFYFTRPERYGITVLIIIIVIVLLYPYLHKNLFPPKEINLDDAIAKVEKYQQLIDEHRAAQAYLESNKNKTEETFTNFKARLKLVRFNPNTLTREEYLEMGLPQRVANNIKAFLNAGGTFRYKEDFQRLYSVNNELYHVIEPYIDLPARPVRELAGRNDGTGNIGVNEQTASRPNLIVELNTADTTELQKIRGIGPAFSRRIIAYRELLGGYSSVGQLMEVFGMDSTRFNQISPYFSVDSPITRKININDADFTTLVRHPYIDRNQANSIIRIREQHGPYLSVEDIMRSDLINSDLFYRISPYITTSSP